MPDLHKIVVPMLIIHGEQDGTVPMEQANEASERIPHCRLILLPECGHHPMIEHPEAYFDFVTRFLTEASASISDSAPIY